MIDSYTSVRQQCCGCRRQTELPRDPMEYPTTSAAPWPSCPQTAAGALEQQLPLAMAYVPWQQWQSTYAPERGLVQGTIFPQLDLPFMYGGCSR